MDLKIWGKDNPDVGRYFLFFTPGVEAGFTCVMRGGAVETLLGGCLLGTDQVDDQARWCYIPETPDWMAIARGES
jgi:hypothetical protein